MANENQNHYHDDPMEPEVPKIKKQSALAAILLMVVGGFYLQTTFAGNISLNSDSPVEFGQGVSQTAACSGDNSLTLTPRSSFTNGSPGAHYFSSVTVSNIPDSCFGVDFTINAYSDNDASLLALFNSISRSVVIHDNAGTFEVGTGSTGMTVASSTGTFTVTFTTPVAQSSNVFKITIQSGAHAPSIRVGNAGPGGGFIYYIDDAGFNCGATYTSTGSPTGGLCHYLEVAPSGWNTGTDPSVVWAITLYQRTNVTGIPHENPAYNNALGIGLGYKNSNAIVLLNGAYNQSSNNYAAGAARAYAGGSKNDWYLPTTAELNLLCQWDRGVPPSVTTACTGGTLNSATYGAQSAGMGTYLYWSASQHINGMAWTSSFTNGHQIVNWKDWVNNVRPVRAY